MKPGATLRVYADLLPASDGTAPFAIHTFNQITGGNSIYPRQAAIANDHFVFTGKAEDDKQTVDRARVRGASTGCEKPYYATPGDGIFHFYFPEQGLVLPGQFIPGADSHSRAYGAYGAVGIGVGSTTLGFGWSTGYVYFTLAKPRRVVFTGKLQPWVGGKDIVLKLLERWGAKQSQGMSVEFVDARPPAPDRVPQHDREHDGRGRGAERHLRARRDHLRVVPREGDDDLPYPPLAPGRGRASTRSTRRSTSPDVVPMIAKPFSPGNAFPADEVARERITFDKAMIGSCTNGSYDDLLQAALVHARGARRRRRREGGERLRRLPGLGRRRAPDRAARPRLGGESIANVLRGGRRGRSATRGAAPASARARTR